MPDTAVLQQPRPAASSMPWHCQAAASRLIERITRTDKQVAALANKYATAIHDPMQRQRSRHSPCRESTMVDLERDWRRNLPPESRLGLVVDWEKSRSRLKGLTISDARLTGFPFNLTNWPIDHTEFGLGALIIKFTIRPNDVSLKTDRLFVITKHALGRRYQRGWPVTDEAVLEDLKYLANARMTQPQATAVPVDSGIWSGTLMKYENNVVLVVLTFLEPTMRSDNYADDNTSLAGRLFHFEPKATVKNAANAVATDLRRMGATNVIADVSSDLCVPATIAATSSWSSPIIPSAGMGHVSFAGKLNQAGNCVINRYADVVGNLLVASTTANITANSAFQCDVSSTVLFQAFNITMSNSGSSVATVSSYIGLLSK